MTMIKSANLALSFLLELVMLAALGYWGFKTGGELVSQIILGIGAPLLVAVVWGIFLAPASARRLREPFHLVLELVIFGLAITALYIAGQPGLALVFGIVYAINLVVRYGF
ncbi:hypothetical protein ARNL5_03544 [Anaerolineae bacterium]|nr:hypothetical protein ARNL5_03544 [Anaerolineae bacterium]